MNQIHIVSELVKRAHLVFLAIVLNFCLAFVLKAFAGFVCGAGLLLVAILHNFALHFEVVVRAIVRNPCNIVTKQTSWIIDRMNA